MNLKIGHKINQWSHHVRQEDLNSWSKILNDPNPIHFDANAVKKIGQGDKCINQGPSLLLNLSTQENNYLVVSEVELIQ